MHRIQQKKISTSYSLMFVAVLLVNLHIIDNLRRHSGAVPLQVAPEVQ